MSNGGNVLVLPCHITNAFLLLKFGNVVPYYLHCSMIFCLYVMLIKTDHKLSTRLRGLMLTCDTIHLLFD